MRMHQVIPILLYHIQCITVFVTTYASYPHCEAYRWKGIVVIHVLDTLDHLAGKTSSFEENNITLNNPLLFTVYVYKLHPEQ